VDQPVGESPIELRRYLGILRARKWTIILIVLVCVALAIGYAFQQTPLYRAQASVLVQPVPYGATSSSVLLPVDVTTESQIVASEPVAVLVQRDLDYEGSIQSLLGPVDVGGGAPPGTGSASGTQVLVVRYISPDPEFAAAAADSFANNYLEYRQKQALRNLLAARKPIQTRLDSVTEQLTQVGEDITEASQAQDASLVTALESQRNVLLARLAVLQQRLDDLQPGEAARSGGGQVIQSAVVPSTPASPNILRTALLGLVMGLGLGVGLAFVRERLDDRFKGRADLELAFNAPVLATVPRFATDKQNPRRLIIVDEPSGIASESYRSLRTNLQFVLSQRGAKSVVLTSASAADGKTATTCNLAVAVAQTGRRVVLVSADLRRPTLENYFGLTATGGLSTYLMENAGVQDLAHDVGIPYLRVIPSGQVPFNPAELLTSPRLPQLIAALEANADLVLFDSPPVLAVSDAAIISSKLGGAVIVVDAAKTHRSAALHAKQEIERAGGIVLGSVLNSFNPSQGTYGYDSAYGYSAEYLADPEPKAEDGKTRTRGRRRSKHSA
jgi:capsular exopolysaccharide synthesis family protein